MADKDATKASVREGEREHYKGRLYERAKELLAREPQHYRQPMGLEIAIVKLFARRDWKPPKWFSEADRDEALKAACDRARGDFAAGAGIDGDAGAGVAGEHGAGKLPIIDRTNRRLRDLVKGGIAALEELNQHKPTVFQRAGVLVRIKREDGAARIEVLDADSLGLMLDENADWIIQRSNHPSPTEPPERVVRAMLKLADYTFAALRGVAAAPFFTAAGNLVSAGGYDRASEVFLDPGELAALDPVPEKPTPHDVELSLKYLKDELLNDFPFATEADHANAIGLILTPFVRPMIDGPIPLHVIDSPQVGTGKSLLASVAHLVATGRAAPTGIESFDRGEAHKAITAMLLEAPPFILLDNVDRRIMSGHLAAVLTAEQWTDRVLGASKMVTIENRAIWIATGNNLTLSSELRRRAVEVRLDAKIERPEERTGFRHPDLKVWTRENRAALVWACLTLIQNWIALGKPASPARPLASFGSWSSIIGGILATAQVEGFLANVEAFRQRADPDAHDWRRFVEEWAAAHASNPVSAEVLAPIAQGLLPDLLGSGNELAQHSRLGRALRKRIGQIIAGWRIDPAEVNDADQRARRGYRLARAGAR